MLGRNDEKLRSLERIEQEMVDLDADGYDLALRSFVDKQKVSVGLFYILFFFLSSEDSFFFFFGVSSFLPMNFDDDLPLYHSALFSCVYVFVYRRRNRAKRMVL